MPQERRTDDYGTPEPFSDTSGGPDQPVGTFGQHEINLFRSLNDKPEAFAAVKAYRADLASKHFWAYRRYMRPKLTWGWWVQDVAVELEAFYRDLKARLRPKLAIEAPPQHGKVVSDDCPVLTIAGWETHGSLEVGDLVFHPSGMLTRVTATYQKMPTRVRVELTNGEVFHVHEEHLWTVYNRNKKRWETIETLQMLKRGARSRERHPLYTGTPGTRGCHYTFQLPLVSPLLGRQKELPADPYMLGVWLGDGTTTDAAITYGQADAAIVAAVVAQGFSRGATLESPKGSGVYRTYFIGMLEQLRGAGVVAKTCGVRSKHIPETYLTASLQQRLELLAGLIDTDGYIYPKNGRVVFVTGDKWLADTFCQLIATFGWRTSVDTVAPALSSSGIEGRKSCYYIGFQPTIAIPCRHPRKQVHVAAVRRRIAIKDITVEPGCGKSGNCITVDAPDGLYLIGRTLQPTHNSLSAADFCTWLAGKEPDWRTIFASYSDGLGMRANREVFRLMTDERFAEVFPDVTLGVRGWTENKDLIEYPSYEGSFRNTTVDGSINGFGLHFGLIDDPVKGAREARQKIRREATWEWFTNDFFGRFADEAGLLVIMTRWHVDDALGRMIEHFGRWSEGNPSGIKVLRYPAIAEVDSRYRKKGQALFPRHKSLSWLVERKKLLTQGGWQAEYQQNPIIVGGGALPVERMKTITVFDRKKIAASVRYWDKAGTDDSDDAAYTAGVLMHKMKDHDPQFVIEHIVHGRWRAFDREAKIKATAVLDKSHLGNYEVMIEQEPGPLWENELTQMADGSLRPLRDVRIGDRVVGKSGRAGVVTASIDKGALPVLRITTESGRVVHSALDHPFLTPTGWAEARLLSVGDILALKPSIMTEPSGEPGEEEARLAGYFVGDGCCTLARNGSPNANVVCSDPSQGEDIRRCAEKLGFAVHQGGGARRNGERWTYYLSRGARDWLRRRGLAGKGTAEKTVPEWIMTAPLQTVANFIGAYFACDGGVHARGSDVAVEFYSTNRSLLSQVSSLLLRFGVYSRLRERHYKPEFQASRRLQYRLMLRRSDDSIARFAALIPVFGVKAVTLGRYTARRGFDQAYIGDTVVAIEPAGALRCRCLSVADERSFLINDFVVHNSGGKESAENTVRNLAGFRVVVDKVTGSKEERAQPFAAQVQGSNVGVVAGDWVLGFFEECEPWPFGPRKDRVDAAAGAFARLIKATAYNTDYSQWAF